MEINATLLGQFITFAILVGFTMKYVWPPITTAIREREKRIADGLASAIRSVHELELAQHKALELLRDAKIQAAEIIEQANRRATSIIEEAKDRARVEGERLISIAKSEIDQELFTAKQALRDEMAVLAISGAEKILQKHIDVETNEQLIQALVTEI